MQVFLPYSDFEKSVSVLDPKRLGNQIYRECLTLIKGGWKNHPAAKIWSNHKHALAKYSIAGLDELKKRGRYYPHHYITFHKILDENPDNGYPDVIGYELFHVSHMSNLIRKNPDYYKPIFGDIPDNIPYVWKR